MLFPALIHFIRPRYCVCVVDLLINGLHISNTHAERGRRRNGRSHFASLHEKGRVAIKRKLSCGRCSMDGGHHKRQRATQDWKLSNGLSLSMTIILFLKWHLVHFLLRPNHLSPQFDKDIGRRLIVLYSGQSGRLLNGRQWTENMYFSKIQFRTKWQTTYTRLLLLSILIRLLLLLLSMITMNYYWTSEI